MRRMKWRWITEALDRIYMEFISEDDMCQQLCNNTMSDVPCTCNQCVYRELTILLEAYLMNENDRSTT